MKLDFCPLMTRDQWCVGTGLQDVLIEPKYRLKEAMPQSQEVKELWRLSLLTKFLEIRMNNLYADFNITKNQVKSMIDSLCV